MKFITHNAGRRVFINQVMACCIYPFSRNTKVEPIGALGVSIHQSPYSVKETIDRIQSFLVQHGATIYAGLNQEAEVVSSGQPLFQLEFLLLEARKEEGRLWHRIPSLPLIYR